MRKMKFSTKYVGRNLHVARIYKGITQQQLAASVGVSREYISRIENGKRAPTLPVLIALMEELEIDANTAFFDKWEEEDDTDD